MIEVAFLKSNITDGDEKPKAAEWKASKDHEVRIKQNEKVEWKREMEKKERECKEKQCGWKDRTTQAKSACERMAQYTNPLISKTYGNQTSMMGIQNNAISGSTGSRTL